MLVELMIISIFLVLVCFLDWRIGIFIFITIGFLQDPLRKMIVNEPVYVSGSVIVFFLITFIGAIKSGLQIRRSVLWATYPIIKLPICLFYLIVSIQAVHTLIKTGSIAIFAIGILGYFLPIATIILAFELALHEDRLAKFLYFYLCLAVVFVSGVFFEVLDFDWPILGNVGKTLYFYTDKARELYSGFMRSSEISAWHGAMGIMLGLMFYTISSSNLQRQIFIPIIAALFIAVIFTGRRKALAEVCIFIVCAFGLRFRIYTESMKVYTSTIFACLIAIPLLFWLFDEGIPFSGFEVYAARSRSLNEDALDRLYRMTFGSFKWVIHHNGVFGAGAGLGSQGLQHFGGMHTGGSAEGGLGKVMAELGIPGLIAFCWLVFEMARQLWRALHATISDSYYKMLMIGLSSIMLANVFNFVIAHQVYGDSFVLLICGSLVGFIFAIPVLQAKAAASSETTEPSRSHSVVVYDRDPRHADNW